MEPLKAVRWKMAEQAAGMGIGDGSVIDLAYRVRVAEERWQTGRADGLGGVELEIAGMRVRAAS